MTDESKFRIFEMMAEMGHEQLMFCSDEASGYRGVIAIHSTILPRTVHEVDAAAGARGVGVVDACAPSSRSPEGAWQSGCPS